MAVMQDTVFKSTIAHETVLALLRRLAALEKLLLDV
jgi:hypothetical protein